MPRMVSIRAKVAVFLVEATEFHYESLVVVEWQAKEARAEVMIAGFDLITLPPVAAPSALPPRPQAPVAPAGERQATNRDQRGQNRGERQQGKVSTFVRSSQHRRWKVLAAHWAVTKRYGMMMIVPLHSICHRPANYRTPSPHCCQTWRRQIFTARCPATAKARPPPESSATPRPVMPGISLLSRACMPGRENPWS